MKVVQRRILASVATVIVITTLGIMARRYTSLESLVMREQELRQLVSVHPITSWLIGLSVYVCLSLIPGTSGKSVIFGWIFGFWSAVLMVDVALTLAAMVTFFLSRLLFREAIENRFGIHLDSLRGKLESDAGFYLLMLRFAHAPFSVVNYGTGATNIVPARTFWWTTQLGLLPGTMVFVFAGTRIPSLSVIADRGVLALLDQTLIAALLATFLLPVAIRWLTAVIHRHFPPRRPADPLHRNPLHHTPPDDDASPDNRSPRRQALSGASDGRR